MIEYYYIARRIEAFSNIGEPNKFDTAEDAEKVWKWIKNKKNFKIGGNTIWKIR